MLHVFHTIFFISLRVLYSKGHYINNQAPVVQRVDNAIHRINHYLADSVVCFVNTYLLDSDLSSGQRYPAFEQPVPGLHTFVSLVELPQQSRYNYEWSPEYSGRVFHLVYKR